MSVTDAISTAANLATAAGIIGVGWQLQQNWRQLVLGFERTFVDRYERIIRDVPLSLLLGDSLDPSRDREALRAFYDYFELCEEEMYYRQVGKISTSTWSDWWEGIALHLRRQAFRTAWEYLRERVNVAPARGGQVRVTQFELLRQAIQAIDTGGTFDPHR